LKSAQWASEAPAEYEAELAKKIPKRKLFESKKEAYRQYDCRAEQKGAFSLTV